MANEMTLAQRKQAKARNEIGKALNQGVEQFAKAVDVSSPKERQRLAEKLVRLALTATSVQPKLLDCTPHSIALALLASAASGIEPDGYNGHLIPYGTQCQFIPDYKGMIQLALRNGVVIDGYAVYDNDEFDYILGTSPSLHHKPAIEDRGELKCAYAVAKFSDGTVKFVVATKEDVVKRKNKSRSSAKSDSPWIQWEETMWVKTAVKMLMKFVPRSPHMQAAMRADDLAEMGVQQTPLSVIGGTEAPVPKETTKTEDVVAALLDSTHSSFSTAIESVETEEEVDALFASMVESNKSSLSDAEHHACVESRDVRKAVIRGEIS